MLALRIFRGLVNLIILIILWAILKNIWEPAAYIFVPLLAIVMFSGLNNKAEQENEAVRHDEQGEAHNEWDGHDNDQDEYEENEYDVDDDDDEDEEDEEYDELVEDAAVIVAQAGYASSELLEAELDIDEEDAEYILNELEEYGVVDEASSDSSVRKVLLTPEGVKALVNSWHEYEDDEDEDEADAGDDEDEAGWHSLRDEQVKNAASVVVGAGYASADLLQFHLAVDRDQAIELLQILEACHIVGAAEGHRTERSVLVTPAWLDRVIREISEEKAAENGIEGLLQHLDALHGMEAAKQHVRQLVDVLSEMKEREDLGLDTYELRMNMIFAGLPGMGQMTIAHIVGKLLYEIDILYEGEVVEVPFCELLGSDPFTTSTKVNDALDEASGNVVVIPDLYRLSEPGAPEQGSEAIHSLLSYLDQCNEDIVVILIGPPNKLNSLLDQYIGIRAFFPYLIPFLRTATPSGKDLSEVAAARSHQFERSSFPTEQIVPEMPPSASPPWEHAEPETVAPQSEPVQQNEERIELDVAQEIGERLEQDGIQYKVKRNELNMVQAEPFDWEAELSRNEELHDQRATLAEWAEQLHAYRERKAKGMYADAPSACFVFKGGAESGRSSLAHWLAGLYKHYGIVARGHVVNTELQNVRSVQELNDQLQNSLQQAEGGLLVVHIHELCSAPERVQAERAVADALMKATDKMNADKVIVIEGPEEEVKAFLAVSSVLRMRFSKQIDLNRIPAEKA